MNIHDLSFNLAYATIANLLQGCLCRVIGKDGLVICLIHNDHTFVEPVHQLLVVLVQATQDESDFSGHEMNSNDAKTDLDQAHDDRKDLNIAEVNVSTSEKDTKCEDCLQPCEPEFKVVESEINHRSYKNQSNAVRE